MQSTLLPKHCLVHIAVALVAALNAGCLPAFKYRLYNNSGLDIVVHELSASSSIAHGSLKKIYPARARFIETSDGRRWCYDTSSLPYFPLSDALKTKEGGELSNHFTLQLEKDGKLYVLSNLSALPSAALSLQPDGFPLSPKTETCARSVA
jgi:hypothetical protein